MGTLASGYSPEAPTPPPGFSTPGLGRRLAAIAYDSLLVLALWFAAGALALAISGGRLTAPDRPVWLLMAFRAALLIATFVFFGWFWTHGGQTLGMRAWRLQLTRRDGGPVNWKQAGLRFLAALLSAAPLGLGYWWVLLDREQRSWHDRLSGTSLRLLPRER